MDEAERKRRLQALALQNNTQPLRVTQPVAPQKNVVVEQQKPLNYKVQVQPTFKVKPKVSITGPLFRPTEPTNDTRAWGTKLFDTINTADSGRSWTNPGQQVAPNWAQRNLSPTGVFNIGKEIVQGTARIPIEVAQTGERQYRLAMENKRRGKLGLPQLDSLSEESRMAVPSKTFTPSGWQKRLLGESKIESYTTQGPEISEAIESATGKKPSPLLVTGGLILSAGPLGELKIPARSIKAITKSKNADEIIKIAAKDGIDLDPETAKALAINENKEVTKNILTKKVEESNIAIDGKAPDVELSNKATADISKPTQTPPKTTDAVANGVANNKNPAHIKTVVDALLPNADETTKTALVNKLVKITDPEEVRKTLDEAAVRQAEITKATDNAIPTGQQVDQATQQEQALQEAVPQPVPARIAGESAPTQEPITPTPTAVTDATTATDVPGAVAPQTDKIIGSYTDPKTGQITGFYTEEDLLDKLLELKSIPLAKRSGADANSIQEIETILKNTRNQQTTTPPAQVGKTVDEVPVTQVADEAQTASGAVPPADEPLVVRSGGEILEGLKGQSEAVQNRYYKNLWQRITGWASREWDPRAEARKIDKVYAKRQGKKQWQLTPDESVEDTLRTAQNYTSAANEFKASNQFLKDVAQKYKGDDLKNFVYYATAKHDIERIIDGRRSRLGMSLEETRQVVDTLEQAYPGIDADVRNLSLGYVDQLLNEATYGKDAFLSDDLYRMVSTKKDGSKYEYYLPINRQMPDNKLAPEIAVDNTGNISRQNLIQSLEKQGGDIQPDLTSLEELADTTFKQMGQARVARILNQRAQENIGNINILQSAEDAAFIKKARQNLSEVREFTKSLRKQAPKTRAKAVRIGQKARTAEKQVVDTAKQAMLQEKKAVADALRKEIADSKVKLKVQKAKLGLPKYKKAQAEGEAVTRARAELNKSIMSADAKAAAKDLSKEDLLEVFDAMANDAPLPKNVLSIFRKVTKSDKAYNDLVDDITGTTQQIADGKEKLVNAIASTKETAEKIRSMSKEDYITFVENVINNEQATKSQIAKYNRYKQSRQDLAYAIDDYEQLKMEIQIFENQAKGIQEDISRLAIGETANKQMIKGIDANGNQFVLEVDPDLYRMLMGIDGKKYKDAIKIGRIIQAPFRQAFTGIVGNPAFQVFQAIVNAVMMPFASDLPLHKIYTPSAMKAAFSAFNNNSAFQKQLAENSVTLYGSDFHKLVSDKTVDALASQSDVISKAKWVANPARGWNAINEVGGKVDRFYRTMAAKAAYDDAIAKGFSPEEAMKFASRAHDTVLPDFNNLGQVIKLVDSTVAMYVGAGQAGTRTLFRGYKNHPYRNTAYTAALVAPMAMVTAYNMSSDAGQKYYEDMKKSGKTWDLDNNVVVVLPTARKDEKTGKWSGIYKIPVPPEMRPVNKAVWNTMYGLDTGEGVPMATYARSIFDFLTGSALSNPKNPAVNTTATMITGRNVETGQEIRDPGVGVWSTQTLRGGLGSLGSVGRGINKAVFDKEYDEQGNEIQKSAGVRFKEGAGTYLGAVPNRFYGSKGSTSGSRFYQYQNEAVNEMGLNKNEIDAYYGTISPRSKNVAGEDIKESTYYDSASKATTWLRYPKTFEVSKAIDAKKRAEGENGDPLFDLDPQQRKVVLNMMANYSPGNKEDVAIKKLNPWLDDFNARRSAYFDAIAQKNGKVVTKTDPMGLTIPKASPELEAKMAQAKQLTLNKADAATKRKFYEDNPDLTEFYQQQDNYERAKRAFLGLPQFDRYPTPSPEVDKLQKEYFALPSKNGPPKKDGTPSSPARSAWIKANPDKWKKITDQWSKQDIYKLQEEGSLAVYEGIDFTEDGIKAIQDLAESLGVQTGYGKFGYGGGGSAKTLAEQMSPDLSTLLAGVQPNKIKSADIIDPTPQKTKFKVKLPSSSKGRSYKRIRLQ